MAGWGKQQQSLLFCFAAGFVATVCSGGVFFPGGTISK